MKKAVLGLNRQVFFILLAFAVITTVSAEVTINNFSVSILKEEHDLVTHNVTIEIKNLDAASSRQFNLEFFMTNTSFDISQARNLIIYEQKPLNTSYPKNTGEIITTKSFYPKDMLNFKYSNSCWNDTADLISYPCNVTKITGYGLDWKMTLDWKPTKMQLVKSGISGSHKQGNITIPKGGSKCDSDDFNISYGCNGTKLFKIMWETPITSIGSGWGSSGYYSIKDVNTGADYDPAWGNTTFTKRIEINVTNSDTIDHVNERIIYHLYNNTDLRKFTQVSFQDIRLTNRSDSAKAYQLLYYQNQTTPDAVGWLANTTAGSTTPFYIYFNSSTALDANTTIFTQYEHFENGSIYMNGGFTPFEGDTGGLIRNVSLTRNTTNTTSLSSGQAAGTVPSTFRHNRNNDPNKDINGSYILTYWQRSNGSFGDYNGIVQSTGPNVWGIATNTSGRILIMNGSNGLDNWVQTPHNITNPNTWYWFKFEKNESGEYYWFTNNTGKFFLGRDESLTENYSQVSLGIVGTLPGTGAPLYEDFLIIQNQPGLDFNEYGIGSTITVGVMENVTACGTYTSNYTMTNSITNSGVEQCIILDAENVRFDCAGFTVDGTDAGSSIGFNISSRADNATIINCISTDWAEGVQTNAPRTVVDNLTAFSNTENFFAGINPTASDGTVRNSNLSFSDFDSIHSRGNSMRYENSTIDGASFNGLNFDGVNSNVAYGMIVHGSSRHGLSISTGGSHSATHSVFSNSSRSGVNIVGSTSFSGTNITAENNTWSGIAFAGTSSGGTIWNSSVKNNAHWAFNFSSTGAPSNIAYFIDIFGNNTGNITYMQGQRVALQNTSIWAGRVADPALWTNVSKYLNITNETSTSWLAINISYVNTSIPTGQNFSEINLTLVKWDGTNWHTSFGDTFTVDITRKIVYGNITNFTGRQDGLVFVLMAGNISGVAGGADITAPTINYVSPTDGNNTYKNVNHIIVNTTATDETGLANITITLNNQTILINTTNGSTSPFFMNFTALVSGNYTFNASATDTSNNRAFNVSRNIVIDLIFPNLTFVAPTPATAVYQRWNSTFLNFTAADLNLANNGTFNIFNLTGLFNFTNVTATPIGISNFFSYNFTNWPDGNYSYNGSISDKAGNRNTTSDTRVLIIDTIQPTNLNFTTPTQRSNITLASGTLLRFNLTGNDTNLANGTLFIYNSAGIWQQSTGSTFPYFTTLTISTAGTYWFNATFTDKANNQNFTDTYQFVVEAAAAEAPAAGTGGGGGGTIDPSVIEHMEQQKQLKQFVGQLTSNESSNVLATLGNRRWLLYLPTIKPSIDDIIYLKSETLGCEVEGTATCELLKETGQIKVVYTYNNPDLRGFLDFRFINIKTADFEAVVSYVIVNPQAWLPTNKIPISKNPVSKWLFKYTTIDTENASGIYYYDFILAMLGIWLLFKLAMRPRALMLR